MPGNKLYIPPKPLAISDKTTLYHNYGTYTDYNYLNCGIASKLKIKHFETSLRLTKAYFGKTGVIDYGCADGPFLGSLSQYFKDVIGIDINDGLIKIASDRMRELGAKNVRLISDAGEIEKLASNISRDNYKILFLLETIEHIGNRNELYRSKLDFIRDLFNLISDDGIIVMSVPKMVGFPYFMQYIGLSVLGLHREEISIKNFIDASIFCDTSELEKNWKGGHLGFNNKTFEKYLKKHFTIVKKKDIFFQRVYVIKNKKQ